MRTIRLKVTSLFEFEGSPPPHSPDLVTITSLVEESFLTALDIYNRQRGAA